MPVFFFPLQMIVNGNQHSLFNNILQTTPICVSQNKKNYHRMTSVWINDNFNLFVWTIPYNAWMCVSALAYIY